MSTNWHEHEMAGELAREVIGTGYTPRLITVDDAHSIAKSILAAGYRKPQQVTTLEELDALPFETVIRDGDDCVLERWGDGEATGWVTVMVTSFVPREQITLPATVLHVGGAE